MIAPALRRPAALLLAGLVLAGCTATGSGASASDPAPSAGIVRTLLGTAAPASAPGQELALWTYTIPAGVRLVPHRHPGWQVARVTSGTLTYTILTGEVVVQRADGTVETHGASETIELTAGDTVVENPDTDHYGENLGTAPVEISAATLYGIGEPPAIPVASPAG